MCRVSRVARVRRDSRVSGLGCIKLWRFYCIVIFSFTRFQVQDFLVDDLAD